MPSTWIAAALLCASACSDGGADRTSEGAPTDLNVVVWLVDTMRADHLHCYGYERETSPFFDALAAEGVLFENAHVQSNWTQPSVGSLITSLPPLRFGRFQKRLPDSVQTMAEIFRDHGYRTAGFTTTIAVAEEYGFSQGFDVYEESGGHLPSRDRALRVGSTFDADTLFEMQLPWLREQARGEAPFFLYLHSVDPHVPLTPPAEFDVFGEPYDGPVTGSVENLKPYKDRADHPPEDIARLSALYDGEIRFNDHHFGRLVDELRTLGVLDRTLIVVLSDHGEEFFERGRMEHGHPNLHEEMTRVPWIMRLPGVVPAGLRVNEIVAGVDVLPTILGLVGIESPAQVTGRDLGGLFEGRAATELTTGEAFAYRAKDPRDTGALRTDRWLLHVEPNEERWELFPLDAAGRESGDDRWSELGASERAGLRERVQQHAQRRARTERFFRPDDDPDGDFEMTDEMRKGLEALGYLGSDD